MPLIMAKRDEINVISAIRGKNETKRFLESMGFVVGSNITVVTEFNGNLIVNIKNTRVAISKSMAAKIFV
ncbi:MAG: FeoA family protein [Phascolarctobacterium sp.]